MENKIIRKNKESLETIIPHYLDFCQYQKRLDAKTMKAYRIDLKQFRNTVKAECPIDITPEILEIFVMTLHQTYKPKTVKRKIASVKAFFHYMEYKNYITANPLNKIQLKFREPVILPKTIPLHTIERFLSTIYKEQSQAKTAYQRRNALRDAAVIELLFATGIRISELCSLKTESVNLTDCIVLIYGKGSKERRIQIGNQDVKCILEKYRQEYREEIERCGHFFVNQYGRMLSDQTVRRMIRKYSSMASIELHITPHMFRHTFATCLLEEDVDIRYIQEMLGHSSIHVTELYTHVAMAKQRDILSTKHPRKNLHIL